MTTHHTPLLQSSTGAEKSIKLFRHTLFVCFLFFNLQWSSILSIFNVRVNIENGPHFVSYAAKSVRGMGAATVAVGPSRGKISWDVFPVSGCDVYTHLALVVTELWFNLKCTSKIVLMRSTTPIW